MKSVTLATLSAFVFLATSCGLSEKEKTALLQAQQAKDDSIRLAQIKQVKDEEALKSALGDSLSAHNNLLERQQNTLILLRTNIYTANDEMTQIKAFHFGRMPQDKENQIRAQELKIQSFVMAQTNLLAAIGHTTETIRDIRKATIEYNNPSTGYNATYTLDVEVEDCQVTRIDFNNGGYLGPHHIAAADIDEDGDASLVDDRGRSYQVHLDD